MNLRRAAATAQRVLLQLFHDKRTLALILLVPPILMTLLRYVFDANLAVFTMIAPIILGVFPLIIMFLITSITMLRERRSGTLDRLMTMPIGKSELIAGYALAFSLVAFAQALVASFVAVSLLDVTVAAGTSLLICAAILAALLGTALGLFASAFAKTEFQAVQFMPAFVFPQLLVCGLFVPREQMATALQWFADIMPMTYSVDVMQQIAVQNSITSQMVRDFVVIIGYAIVALALAALTIRRKS